MFFEDGNLLGFHPKWRMGYNLDLRSVGGQHELQFPKGGSYEGTHHRVWPVTHNHYQLIQRRHVPPLPLCGQFKFQKLKLSKEIGKTPCSTFHLGLYEFGMIS